MNAARLARLPLHAAAVLGREKSFRKNPVLRSRWLNERGLHRRRVAVAAALSARRRAALAARLDPAERAQFDENGFVMREDALPADVFARLTDELARMPRPAWETRQGHAVTRLMPLPPTDDGSALAAARGFLRSPDVRRLTGYCAGRTGHLMAMLQTIAVEPAPDDLDPQAMLHSDTFHPTAKLWLFLHDVGEADGPFSYVPGSHRLTPERLAWEHEQALTAAGGPDPHHAAGSFRLPQEQLPALGYGRLQTFPVRANTMVIADTYGFHRRTPSVRPTVRTELYAMVRRNPFVPWNGGDAMELPWLSERALWIYLRGQDRKARAGKRVIYTNVGRVLPGEPGVLLRA